MTKTEMQKIFQARTVALWDSYCEIFPALVKFDPPKIVINNRFTKTAGCNHTESNIIEMGGKFILAHYDTMIRVILPHEIAHQIDFDINGWYDRKPHHGKQWQSIMLAIGQEPNPYHSMVL